MVPVTLFGGLVVTLAEGWSVALLVVALGAAAFLARTLSGPLGELPDGAPGGLALPRERPPGARLAGFVVSVAALVLVIAGVRVGDGWTATLAVALATAAAAGSWTACGWLAAGRGLRALAAERAREESRGVEAEAARLRQIVEARGALLEGDDLRAEVAAADAAVEKLRAALEALRGTRAELEARAGDAGSTGLGGSSGASHAVGGPSAAGDAERARDDLGHKLELGERVLGAAEGAAFRLACGTALRRLLRRRPREDALQLVPQGPGESPPSGRTAAAAEAARAALRAFVGEVRAARGGLDALEERRPAGTPSGDGDPLARARLDLDALAAAYLAVLERVEVIRLRLAARAGMEEVASAAEDVSARTRTAGLDADELAELSAEVSRADAAMISAVPDDPESEALPHALALVEEALARGDTASLAEIADALRELG